MRIPVPPRAGFERLNPVKTHKTHTPMKKTGSGTTQGRLSNAFGQGDGTHRRPSASHKKPPQGPGGSASWRQGLGEGDNQATDEPRLDGEQLLEALLGLKSGNFGVRLPAAWTGLAGKVSDAFNGVAELMGQSTQGLSRISTVVGEEGRITDTLAGHGRNKSNR
jgi:hypothetical protein